MDRTSPYDLPLDALKVGEHAFSYELRDEFFAAYESELLSGGHFDVDLLVTRVANQFTLAFDLRGSAHVNCDRCLDAFALPLDLQDEVIIKFANGAVREEEDVIYVPYGTERFDVAKLMFDAVGLALPMRIVHEEAELACDPEMVKFLDGEQAAKAPDDDTPPKDIPEDSPWSALRGLSTEPSDN